MPAHRAITFTSRRRRRRRRRRRPPRLRSTSSTCTSRCSCRTTSRSRTLISGRNRSVIFARSKCPPAGIPIESLVHFRSVLVVPAPAVRPVHAVADRPEAAQFFTVAAVFPAAVRASGMQTSGSCPARVATHCRHIQTSEDWFRHFSNRNSRDCIEQTFRCLRLEHY